MTDKTDKRNPKTTTITIVPELQAWIDEFKMVTKTDCGFTPSLQQCMVAYMTQSLPKMMGTDA